MCSSSSHSPLSHILRNTWNSTWFGAVHNGYTAEGAGFPTRARHGDIPLHRFNTRMTATAIASPNQYPNGYSRYADIISRDPELSVYRRFRRLSARNLLYLQSELRLLEEDLDRFDKEDQPAEAAARSQQQPYLLARSYDKLMADSQDASSPTKQASQDRINAITRLRAVMKEYRT
jgi:hypothetical protein